MSRTDSFQKPEAHYALLSPQQKERPGPLVSHMLSCVISEIIHLPWKQDFKLHTDTRHQTHKVLQQTLCNTQAQRDLGLSKYFNNYRNQELRLT